MTEPRIERCCMCPNLGNNTVICPGIAGTPHPEASPCGFVNTFVDSRGWKYRVIRGIGADAEYKGRYQKPGKSGWKGMRNLEWQQNFDLAQSDLNLLAKLKGWRTIG